MRILSFETSTRNFSLAVSDGEKVVRHRNARLAKLLSSSIIPSVDRVLKAAGMAVADMDGFAVGVGPGSFTSLRVGLATVKGLAFAGGKPLVGIPSLDVIAEGVKKEAPETVCVLGDARRNLAYACVYGQAETRIKAKTDYLLHNIETILGMIEGKVLFTGDGIPLFHSAILSEAKKTKRFVPFFAEEKRWYPQARHMVPLALERFCRNDTDSLTDLHPIYLYPEDCQVSRSPAAQGRAGQKVKRSKGQKRD